MKELSKLNLKEVELTPNEIKQILGGFGSGSSGESPSGDSDVSGDSTCQGVTGSCAEACKPGCKDGCKTSLKTGKE